MAYSRDLKRRVLDFVAQGGSKAQAARRFQINTCTVFVWLGQPADHRPGKPGPKTGHKIDRDRLRQLVQTQPDLMLKELAAKLGVSINGVSRCLMVLGISRKKNAALRQRVHRPRA